MAVYLIGVPCTVPWECTCTPVRPRHRVVYRDTKGRGTPRLPARGCWERSPQSTHPRHHTDPRAVAHDESDYSLSTTSDLSAAIGGSRLSADRPLIATTNPNPITLTLALTGRGLSAERRNAEHGERPECRTSLTLTLKTNSTNSLLTYPPIGRQ